VEKALPAAKVIIANPGDAIDAVTGEVSARPAARSAA